MIFAHIKMSVLSDARCNMTVLYTIGFFISALILIVYYISTWKYKYWEKKKVPYASPLPLVGNYGEYIFMKKHSGKVVQELCEQFPDEPYFGTFFGTEPALVVKDPELLKLILTKDFYYFSGREVSKYNQKEIITQNLFLMHGDNWKVVRQNLTPLFSSAKMKNMFYLIDKCNQALEAMVDYETSLSKVVEVKSLMSRYTIDCITSCAFGVEANTMGEGDDNNPFKEMSIEIFNPSTISGVKLVMRLMWPAIFYALNLRWFPKTIDNFFTHVMKGVFQKRNYEPSQRHDFVDSVLSFKRNSFIVGDGLTNDRTGERKKVQIKVDDDMLVSQCVLFFSAGFETSSTALTFTLYELAKNRAAQDRARAEVDEYFRKHDGKIDYSCVSELPYLDACLQETSRLYPVFGILAREVMDDYTFPTGLHVGKGMRIHIPVSHIHKNPDYFPDPLKYKPERFLPDAKDTIKPYTYLSFGEGPRTCIGMRFAKMQGIAGLATMLRRYRVELADGMPHTVEIDPRIYLAQPACDIRLKMIRRE